MYIEILNFIKHELALLLMHQFLYFTLTVPPWQVPEHRFSAFFMVIAFTCPVE
jgi:hypothetical protein